MKPNPREDEVLPEVRLDYSEMQDFTHRALGKFFVTFANVELNLAVRIGGTGAFHDKLERFFDEVTTKCTNDEVICQAMAWYMAADSIRRTRNQFAHGRWGFIPVAQKIVHVSGYSPETQVERRYSPSELDAFVRDIELLSKELYGIPPFFD